MEIICKPRRNGKTYDLIEFANGLKGYNLIVCSDRRAVDDVWRRIIEKKYDLPQPITFDDFLKNRYCGINVNSILIDNVDFLIQEMTSTKITCVTITEEDLK